MELLEVKYNPIKAVVRHSEEREKFKDDTECTNVVYFFFSKDECLYIGEEGTSLYERCFRHTPKECDSSWFKESDTIKIIVLDKIIDKIARKTIERIFIETYRPKYNKE